MYEEIDLYHLQEKKALMELYCNNICKHSYVYFSN